MYRSKCAKYSQIESLVFEKYELKSGLQFFLIIVLLSVEE